MIKDRNFFILDTVKGVYNENESYLIEEGTTEINFPIQLKIRELISSDEIKYNRHFLYIDAEKVKYPFSLRRWKAGDWFIPFGMKGRKKLSDYFTDRKFSLRDKDDAWILTSGDDIVWIVSERNDDRFKITENTKTIIAIEHLC